MFIKDNCYSKSGRFIIYLSMTYKAQLLSLLLTFTLLLLSSAQKPPFWGGNPAYTVKVKLLNNKPVATWNFTYYYNWTQKVERYQHESPQTDQACALPVTTFRKTGEPCHVTFATDGYFYISYPTHNFCCKCSKSFGSIRYDWLQEGSTFVGYETVNGKNTTHWTKQGAELNNYWATVGDQLPVRFYELKGGAPKSWDFDLTTYKTDAINPAKFQPQCTTPCIGPCSVLEEETSSLQTK